MKHDAFISYRHTEAQQRLARALERGLQRFAKPLFKARARAVFRDEANLNLSPHLWGSIESALDDSRFFLYMASPDSARSKWVGKEVEHWRSNRGLDHMILLLTDGDLVWDEAAGDFDAAASTAIAPALHGAFEGEPFYLDLRWTREAEDLSLDNPAFKQAIVQIVATVEGKSVENMMGEEFEQHRRATRIRNLAIGALGLLAVLAGGAAIVASQQRAEAVARAREATLRLLSLQADQEWKDSKYGREGPAVAKFLYEHLPEDPLAQQVIFKVLNGRQGRSTPIHTGEWVPFADFSQDGDAIVLGLASGEVRLLELGGAEIGRFPSPHGAALSSATPVANGSVLAAYEDGAVILWTPAGPMHLESPGVRSVRGAAAGDASRLVTWSESAAVLRDALGNRIAAIELEEGKRCGTPRSRARAPGWVSSSHTPRPARFASTTRRASALRRSRWTPQIATVNCSSHRLPTRSCWGKRRCVSLTSRAGSWLSSGTSGRTRCRGSTARSSVRMAACLRPSAHRAARA